MTARTKWVACWTFKIYTYVCKCLQHIYRVQNLYKINYQREQRDSKHELDRVLDLKDDDIRGLSRVLDAKEGDIVGLSHDIDRLQVYVFMYVYVDI